MEIRQWKEFAELVALLAVVGGLVAVVVELRQTQSALKAQAYQARAFNAIEISWGLSTDPELDVLLANFESANIEIDSVTPLERSKLLSFYYVKRTDLDNEHYQFSNGFLDPDFYQTTTEPEIKAFAPIWRSFGISEPRREFTDEVNRILEDSSVSSSME